ncbi:hypothetical protein HYDPIDRAFT_116611 [Hydnomerulius pinastri MD-312]|uniref:Unplaced genomic scaffold scaffold_33, whole genome shotgun sequence n=1 Tax=Hydnomerulius pinastri MD-312 TaxID=994086 RepID=A0A0C9W3R9_9AGAM|nr:hypothetical protein HYDPIDRAFT_116611 [Hydnomerulius pinastri MD-312]
MFTVSQSTQYGIAGTLCLMSATVMLVSGLIGRHSKMDAFIVVVSAFAFILSADQFRRAFLSWREMRRKVAETDV